MDDTCLREQICEVCRRMWRQGFAAANDGNVSAKLREGLYLVTPSGYSKIDITPDMLLTVGPGGEILQGPEGLRPSSEIRLHLLCYREREDVGGVVHAHPPAATGFAVAHQPLDRRSTIESVLTLGSVPLTPYATPSTEEVPEAVRPYVQDHDAFLLANHGALTVGVDVATAHARMETLEHWARVTLAARLLGGEQEIPAEQAERLCAMRAGYGLTGRHPGVRQQD